GAFVRAGVLRSEGAGVRHVFARDQFVGAGAPDAAGVITHNQAQGKVMVNRVCPSPVSMAASPPWTSAIRRIEYVPSPRPPVLPAVAYLSKKRPRMVSGTSPSLSITTCRHAGPDATSTLIVPPGGAAS